MFGRTARDDERVPSGDQDGCAIVSSPLVTSESSRALLVYHVGVVASCRVRVEPDPSVEFEGPDTPVGSGVGALGSPVGAFGSAVGEHAPTKMSSRIRMLVRMR